MQFKKIITNFINKTFRDEIIAIEPVTDWVETYRDKGVVLEGYIVPVTYKYRGRENRTFCIDNGHFQLVSPQQALKSAQDFYLRTSEQIKQRNENIK